MEKRKIKIIENYDFLKNYNDFVYKFIIKVKIIARGLSGNVNLIKFDNQFDFNTETELLERIAIIKKDKSIEIEAIYVELINETKEIVILDPNLKSYYQISFLDSNKERQNLTFSNEDSMLTTYNFLKTQKVIKDLMVYKIFDS